MINEATLVHEDALIFSPHSTLIYGVEKSPPHKILTNHSMQNITSQEPRVNSSVWHISHIREGRVFNKSVALDQQFQKMFPPHSTWSWRCWSPTSEPMKRWRLILTIIIKGNNWAFKTELKPLKTRKKLFCNWLVGSFAIPWQPTSRPSEPLH